MRDSRKKYTSQDGEGKGKKVTLGRHNLLHWWSCGGGDLQAASCRQGRLPAKCMSPSAESLLVVLCCLASNRRGMLHRVIFYCSLAYQNFEELQFPQAFTSKGCYTQQEFCKLHKPDPKQFDVFTQKYISLLEELLIGVILCETMV